MANAKKTASEAPIQLSGADEKKRALETALHNIEKEYGKGAIMKLGENSAMSVTAVSTGSLTLDLALGVGGIPKGRIIETEIPVQRIRCVKPGHNFCLEYRVFNEVKQ